MTPEQEIAQLKALLREYHWKVSNWRGADPLARTMDGRAKMAIRGQPIPDENDLLTWQDKHRAEWESDPYDP